MILKTLKEAFVKAGPKRLASLLACLAIAILVLGSYLALARSHDSSQPGGGFDGLPVCDDSKTLWYMDGELPPKMNIELDESVKMVLGIPSGLYPGSMIECELMAWFGTEEGRKVYEHYGGMFVDAAGIYIVLTNMTYVDDILAVIGDEAKAYGATLTFLKGKYSLGQLEKWQSMLAEELLCKLNPKKVEGPEDIIFMYIYVAEPLNLVVVGVNSLHFKPEVIRKAFEAALALGIPEDAIIFEKSAPIIPLPELVEAGWQIESYSDDFPAGPSLHL